MKFRKRARVRTRTLALPALVLALAAPATATAGSHHDSERFVVRGEATIQDGGDCAGAVCELEMTGGAFRGTIGTGGYSGSMKLMVAKAFPNGEDGVCAPIRGRIVLGEGTPDRLVLAVAGDSCQDGAGPPPTTSFTTVARFVVKHGTGAYAKARGSGIAVFAEDAADHDRMTLIGRIAR